MRSAFKTSRFVTYRNGRLNVFGFDAKKRYGFAEGVENVKMSLDTACEVAEIAIADLPEKGRERLEASRVSRSLWVKGQITSRVAPRLKAYSTS
jgi:hypothetical protein